MSGLETGGVEYAAIRKDRGVFPVMMHCTPIHRKNRISGLRGIIIDITSRKHMERKLEFLSLCDSLTGIYNRSFFQREMDRIQEDSTLIASIVLCDLDGLKLINDTLGHSKGNMLLVAAARIIKSAFRSSDVVARVGGDEFAILIPESSIEAAQAAYNRIKEAVEQHNEISPELPLSISVGYASGCPASQNLSNLFKEADDNMYREKLSRKQTARNLIIQTLFKAMEKRDFTAEYNGGGNLEELVASMAKALKLTSAACAAGLQLLARYHDIGNVGIPEAILFKPGPLTTDEIAEVKRHCEIGYRIAQIAPELKHIASFILKHHEWWNGQGYPAGLKGDDIPLECRIFAIADAYCSMTAKRPYRGKKSGEQALAEINLMAGIQFDPHLVRVFTELIGPF
ncbi:MAG: Cyclic di-GMP phosphodiesterase response regulator RpfG [Pelotomaculum sp. PtaB.Bin104]|nr:MAG: Cyclic di-GMP phosphodiesterase response regulator RpfG [Pelotomaculum sp. PtaB.Bin104]